MLDAGAASRNTTLAQAFCWAEQHIGVCESRILTQTPWGTTAHLWTDSVSAYLKVLGAGQSSAIDAWKSASYWAADNVPPVIADDPEQGLLLIADHGATGEIRTQDPSIAGLLDCVTTLQAVTARDAYHVSGAQPVTAVDVLDRVDQFFRIGDVTQSGLNDYFGASRAKRYRTMFQASRDSLGCALGIAFALAPCFNHGDLHRRNAALDDNGRVWIHDWDTSYWGPAPLAFAGMLTSANDITRCFDRYGWFQDTEAQEPETVILEAALKSLVAKGYADEATLRRAFLPGLMAGVLLQLTEYRHFRPTTDEDYQVCVPHIEQLLAVLLRLLAIFAAQSASQTRAFADALIGAGHTDTATFLLYRAVDVQGLAPKELVPEDNDRAKEVLRILTLNAAMHSAEDPECCPALPAGPDFVSDDAKLAEICQIGQGLFSRHGCLVLENAISTEIIDQCRAALVKNGTGAEGVPLNVGDKRAMSAVAVGGAFNEPMLYAAKPLIGILQQLLGEDLQIGSYTVVTSHPGAAEQHLHIDHAELYPELAQQPDTPPFAVTVLIPLVDIDETLGGTQVLKGSHRVARKQGQSMPRQFARSKRGSVLMFDYRLFHAGEPNCSDVDRPVLSIVFHRSWFRDASNFSTQAPLQITTQERDRIPKEYVPLFGQAKLIQDPTT